MLMVINRAEVYVFCDEKYPVLQFFVWRKISLDNVPQ